MTSTDYQKQAQDFLDRFGIKFRATLSDSKVAPWHDKYDHERHHFRICLSKKGGGRIVFDFFESKAHSDSGSLATTPYSVLACISGDAYCPEDFKEFCDEYGYESDSIKALQMFRRCSAFGRRLRNFFTAKELEELSEIR